MVQSLPHEGGERTTPAKAPCLVQRHLVMRDKEILEGARPGCKPPAKPPLRRPAGARVREHDAVPLRARPVVEEQVDGGVRGDVQPLDAACLLEGLLRVRQRQSPFVLVGRDRERGKGFGREAFFKQPEVLL